MAYPDLYKDESKILDAQNIKVKSVSFDAILTTRRLILIDHKKPMAPPQEILLATLKNVDTGENAIRDPTITLSIIASTGSTRQMILTFSKTSGGERKREADEWMKVLRQHVSQTIRHPVLPDIPGMEDEEPLQIPVSTPAAPPAPRVEIVNAPPQKKRIEISRPMKKIIESAPAIPQPVETTTLPVGSFCNRCGSRVPPESAFCNHCGTPVVKESDMEAALRQPLPPEPVPEPAPVVPQVAVPVPPVFGHGSDKKERPIEEVIHSIEPLIEDSVPRTEPAPLIGKPRHAHAPEPVVSEEKTQPSEPGVQWPVISSSVPESGVPPVQQDTPPPQPVPGKAPGKRGVFIVAVLAVVILAIIAGVFLFANPLQPAVSGVPPVTTTAPTATSTPAATLSPVATLPVGTTAPATAVVTETPAPAATTAAVSIPALGVWVRITYANRFIGTVGTPGAERDVGDTGDKIYQISTSTGTAVASVKKKDGSADELAVELYKDGNLVTRKSTTAPNGLVEIQVSLKPAPTATPTQAPTPVPTTAVPATGNATVNATVTTSVTP